MYVRYCNHIDVINITGIMIVRDEFLKYQDSGGQPVAEMDNHQG